MEALNVTTTFNTLTGAAGASWGGTVIYLALFVFIPLGILGVLVAGLWDVAQYTRFKKYLEMFGASFKYFITGCISLAALSIPMGLIYWGYNQAKSGNTVPFKRTFYIIIAYLIIAGIGKLVDKYVMKRIIKFEKQIKGGKE